MDPESIALARAVGEQVLRDEHGFFVDEGTDNSEHVPRIGRIAESVRRALEQEGCDAVDADLSSKPSIWGAARSAQRQPSGIGCSSPVSRARSSAILRKRRKVSCST